MSKMGLGSFMSGMAQGYVTGTKLGLEEEKAQREKELFGLQKQETELKLKREKDEDAFREDMKASLAPLYQEMSAAMAPPEPQNGLQGTQPAPKPLNLTEVSQRFADTSLSVAFKHGKVTLDQLKQARDLRKEMDKENVDEAVNTWLTTGDKNKVAEVFNKGGKFKFDPNTMDIRTVKDPAGLLPANVVVVGKNPDGTEREMFNYQEVALAGISKDTYAQLVNAAKIQKNKSQTDVFTTGMTTQATIAAANAKADKTLPPEVKAFHDKMNKEFESIFKGTGFNLNPREESVLRGEIGALGRQLIDAGKTSDEAYILATRAVLQKNKIPVDLSRIK